MKKTTLLLFFLATIITATAQKISLKEIAQSAYRAEGIRGVKPMLDGEHYTQMSPDGKRIVKYSFKTGKEVATIFDVTTARNVKLEKFDNYTFSPNEAFILIQTETKPIYRHSFTAVHYIYNVRNRTLESLSDNGPQQVPLFSPDNNQIAFVRDNNIYLIKLLFGNSESQVTTDGKFNEILNGIPDWVYEEEFAFNRAFDFSANSEMIAYIRFDESKLPSYAFPLYKGRNPALEENESYPGEYRYKYPMAGVNNSEVSVHTFDIKSKVTRKVDLPLDKDGYIPRIQFTNDSEALAIATLNRHQNRYDLYIANPKNTLCKLVVRDEAPQYIKEEAYANIKFYDKHFVTMSEKDGYNHLYLYTNGGNLVKQITKGSFEVKSFLGWDEISNTFYYESNEESPLQTAIYKIDAKGKKTKISTEIGTNKGLFSTNMKYYMNTFSSINTPPVITLNDNNGKRLTTLIDNKKLKEKLASKQVGTKEFFTFTTPEGVELNGWMIKPANFSPSQKYPIIMHQYSGPGSQRVLNQWAIGARRDGALFESYLTDLGYIAVCVDGRGTGGRGVEFEKCTYLQLGLKEAKDQVHTAKYLASLPYVDGNRIGIWGWSYGGYNTIMSMSEGVPTFKAGVAVAAPTDWRFYDTVYTERFMRTPKENMEGYEATSAINRASKLNGNLLLIHGTADDNVHLRNMMEYSEALVEADKQFDMHVYTNRNHGISGGNTTYHLLNRVINHFNRHLK